jgi:hypothetical protein
MIWSFPGISAAAKSRICPREPWNKVRALLLMRASGAYSIHEYRQFIEPRLDSRWKLFIAKMAALVPGSIPNLLAVMYYTLKPSQDIILWHGLTTSTFYYREDYAILCVPWKKQSHSGGAIVHLITTTQQVNG